MPRKHRQIPPLRPQEIERFRARVDVREPDECWPWQGDTHSGGYGVLWLGRPSLRRIFAHRAAWIIANKRSIPDGLCVLHHCDNPPCQNPHHLFLGTQADNVRDMYQKGRQVVARGERRSSAKLSAGQVRTIRHRYAAGNISQSALAREYEVGQDNISRIVNRKRWAHVA